MTTRIVIKNHVPERDYYIVYVDDNYIISGFAKVGIGKAIKLIDGTTNILIACHSNDGSNITYIHVNEVEDKRLKDGE